MSYIVAIMFFIMGLIFGGDRGFEFMIAMFALSGLYFIVGAIMSIAHSLQVFRDAIFVKEELTSEQKEDLDKILESRKKHPL